MIWWKPRPVSPSTRSGPTKQSSKTTSRVSEACQPSFASGGLREIPSSTRGSTTKVVMPRCPASGSVLAATMITSARPALVMNILVPLIR